MNITKEKATEILKLYEGNKKDLFNWCEEYKSFISSCVHACMSYEVEYMLKKSYEDSESPLSYEDIDLFDLDQTKENALYLYDTNEEEFNNYANDPDTFNRKVKNKGDFEVFLNSLDTDELKELCNDLSVSEAQTEVYEWWVISDPLKYRLEQQGEIFIKGACCEFWGRTCTGQSISLDSVCIHAFIDLLKDIK